MTGAHFDPEMLRVINAVRSTAPEALVDDTVWITSANDGRHGDASLHYHNRAFDFRIKNIEGFKQGEHNAIVQKWVDDIKLILGKDYDIIYGDEKHLDHFHIEHDPKD